MADLVWLVASLLVTGLGLVCGLGILLRRRGQ
jgi:hypothetical protein